MSRTLHIGLAALLVTLLGLPAGCKSDPPAHPPRGEELAPPKHGPGEMSSSPSPTQRSTPMRRTAPDTATIRNILAEASAMVTHGRAMEKLQTKDVVRCVRLMRKDRPAARRLQSRLWELPSHFRVPLATAVGSLDLCVTCSPSARRYCLAAERGIATARSALGIPVMAK